MTGQLLKYSAEVPLTPSRVSRSGQVYVGLPRSKDNTTASTAAYDCDKVFSVPHAGVL